MSDSLLRARVIRLAHEHPEFRKDLLPLIKQAEAASNGGFPPDTIGESPAKVEGENGKGTVSDAGKPWMKGEFTQQEFVELDKKQESGQLSDGKADPAAKVAQIKAAAKGGKSAKEASELAFREARALGESADSAVKIARAVFKAWKA